MNFNITKIDEKQIENLSVSALDDVNLSSLANNDIITYEASSGQWVNKPLDKNPDLEVSLDELNDVSVSGATPNDVITFDGSEWVNTQDITLNSLQSNTISAVSVSADSLQSNTISAVSVSADDITSYNYYGEIDGGSAVDSNIDIIVRNDTSQNWVAENPTLPKGVMGYETNTGLFKFGDGDTAWNDGLPHHKQFYGAGVIHHDPVVTEHNDPVSGNVTIDVGDLKVALYNNANFSGIPLSYEVVGVSGIPLTNNKVNYLTARYVGVDQAELYLTTNVDEVNESNCIPIDTMLVTHGYVHKSHWDRIAEGLPNKLHRRFVKTQRYARESGLGIFITNITTAHSVSGVAWRGARAFELQEVDFGNMGNGDIWYYYYPVNGIWTSSVTAGAYNNSTYNLNGDVHPLQNPQYWNINWYFRGVEDHNHVYYITSDKEYKTEQDAIAESKIPMIPIEISSHAILIGRAIVKSGFTGAPRVEQAFDMEFSGSVLNNHNQLAGIQGGVLNDDIELTEYYHLSNSDYQKVLYSVEVTGNKGQINGYASLDSAGKVPSQQLPAYVDDVREYAVSGDFPASGDVPPPTSGVIYIAIDTGKVYRYNEISGTYFEVSQPPANTDAVPEGATNKYYTDQRVLSAVAASGGYLTAAVTSVNGSAGPTINLTTSHVPEGTNLYYLDSRALSAVAASGGYSEAISGRQPYHGFVNRTSTTLSVSGITFTLSGSNYEIYFNGVKKTFTSTVSASLSASPEWSANIPSNLGQWFIWITPTGALGYSKIPWDILDINVTPVATVYLQHNGTNYIGILAEERHGYSRNLTWHNHAHYNYGTAYTRGFTVTPTFTSSNTFNFTGGLISDEDIQNSIYDGSIANSCQIGYIKINVGSPSVSALYFETASNAYVKTGTNGRALWDNAGVLAELSTNSQFGIYWIYGTNRTSTPVISIMGQGVYGSIAEAQTAPYPNLAGLSVAEWRLLYRVIIQGSNANFTYRQADSLYNQSLGPVIIATPPTNVTIAASNVSFIATTSVSSTNVQSAIAELDNEKVPYTGAVSAVNLGIQNLSTSGNVVTGTLTTSIISAGTYQGILDKVNNWTAGQAGEITNLSVSANAIAINLANSNNFSVTLQATTAQELSAPSNPVVGQSGAIVITQNATISNLTYNTFWKFNVVTDPNVTGTPNGKNILFYYVYAIDMAYCSLVEVL